MRIRKRKVPLPISLLSPVPLSDPHLFSQFPVMLQSSDMSAPDLDRLIVAKEVEDGGEEKEENNDNINASKEVVPPISATNNNVPVAILNEDKRVVPLKKRPRDGIEQPKGNDNVVVEKIVIESKSKDEDAKEYEHGHERNKQDVISTGASADNTVVTTSVVGAKKAGSNKRGNTIMEGSRCSRVNGRGWRCCQPTLVGYSLCEHHLGKGRLRSIVSSTARSRPSPNKKKASPHPLPPASRSSLISPLSLLIKAATDEREEKVGKEEEKEEEEEKPMMVSYVGKRVKLGVVKARSLSSLLNQPTNVGGNYNNNVDIHLLKNDQNQ